MDNYNLSKILLQENQRDIILKTQILNSYILNTIT